MREGTVMNVSDYKIHVCGIRTYHSRVDGRPCEQDAKVESDARMQTEEDLPASLDDVV
jgi:hypothetical protein